MGTVPPISGSPAASGAATFLPPASVIELSSDDPGADVAVGPTGFSIVKRYGRTDITAAAEITNTSSGFLANVSWRAAMLATDGSVIKEATGRTPTIPAGATVWAVPGFHFDATKTPPAKLVLTIDGADRATTIAEVPLAEAPLRVKGTRTYVDVNGDLHIEGVVTNTGSARLTVVYYACGVYDVGGTLVGGAYGFVNEVLPGGEAGFDTTSNLAPIAPKPADVRCYASPENSSTFEPGGAGSGLVARAGFTYNPAGGQGKWYDLNLGAAITNPSDKAAYNVETEIDLLDADGAFVHAVALNRTFILPGETWYTGAFPVVDRDSEPPAKLRIRTRVGAWGDPTKARVGEESAYDLTKVRFAIKGARYYRDRAGLGIIGGTATNTSGQDLGASTVGCTLFGDADQATSDIVGGGTWTLPKLAAGKSTAFEMISHFTGKVVYATTGCSVHLSHVYGPSLSDQP